MPSKPTRQGVQPEPVDAKPEQPGLVGVGGGLAPGATATPGGPNVPPSEDDDDLHDDQPSLGDEDDEDEDLITFTAREAAGALATISSFTWPFLRKYRSWIVIVGLGLLDLCRSRCQSSFGAVDAFPGRDFGLPRRVALFRFLIHEPLVDAV